MSFKRSFCLDQYYKGDGLTKKLIGIGFKIGGEPELNPNIEDTLISAAIEGILGDFRTLSLLTDWITIHHKIINIDRLSIALMELKNPKVNAYFSAIFSHLKETKRYKKIINLYKGPPQLLEDKKSYAFLIERNGEDIRFKNSKFKVANGSLRARPEDISSPAELAKIHKDYYFRVLMGPCFRADMISIFIRKKDISPSELAHSCYGSYATAWEVINDIRSIEK